MHKPKDFQFRRNWYVFSFKICEPWLRISIQLKILKFHRLNSRYIQWSAINIFVIYCRVAKINQRGINATEGITTPSVLSAKIRWDSYVILSISLIYRWVRYQMNQSAKPDPQMGKGCDWKGTVIAKNIPLRWGFQRSSAVFFDVTVLAGM